MNKNKLDDNIPTLTQIIKTGDESMRNHFDASYFDSDVELELDNIDTSNLVEKQEPFIGDDIKYAEQHDEIEPVIADPDNDSDALQSTFQTELDKTIDLIQSELQEAELEKTIDLIIYDAVQKVMPEIEQKLTQQISQQIKLKVFNKNIDE